MLYLASLSIWSPKPGVSTTVREMRVPSSSSSSSAAQLNISLSEPCLRSSFSLVTRTNSVWLYPNSLFNVSVGCVVVVEPLEHLLSAECVYKGGSSWKDCRFSMLLYSQYLMMRTGAGGSADHDAELDTLLDILLAPYLDLCEHTLVFPKPPSHDQIYNI